MIDDSPPTPDEPMADEPMAAPRQSLPRVRWGRYFEFHPIVFPVSASVILALVVICFLFPAEQLGRSLTDLRVGIGQTFGWFYVITMTGLVAFACWLSASRFGSIRLGGDDELPEFNRGAWFAMLFSAGMGIGLLFYSVAEPAYHFNEPPPGFADGLATPRLAMAVTIFHWGLHPWALYAVVGLALAYFGFRLKMPLSFRSLLHPLLGDRVWGLAGDLIDCLAIIATLTGVATSLGIGAQQVNAGLASLLGIEVSTGYQVLLITGITAIATVSVVMGLDAGIRRLSEWNIWLAGLLLVLVVIGGGIDAFFGAAVENIGAYLQTLPFSAFRTGAYSETGRKWLTDWTVFYWAWWISWSPFVGMFIARISRGRTIREFVMGVVIVPTLVGIVWLTAFGSTTLRSHQAHRASTPDSQAANRQAAAPLPEYWVAELDAGGEPILDSEGRMVREQRALTAVEYLDAPIVNAEGTQRIDQLPTVLFALIDELFTSQIITAVGIGIATLAIIMFFVTSSDSASMVIDIIASGGNPNPPVGTRLFWAVSEGVVAAALLCAGGLSALQAAAIATALPFTVIIIATCVSLMLKLSQEPIAPSPDAVARPLKGSV